VQGAASHWCYPNALTINTEARNDREFWTLVLTSTTGGEPGTAAYISIPAQGLTAHSKHLT